jgi:large subunit ribosomal protein L35
MPKMKTHSGAAKRFSVTKSGKVKRGHAGTNHFMMRKSKRCKRGLRQNGLLAGEDAKNIKKMIPYK